MKKLVIDLPIIYGKNEDGEECIDKQETLKSAMEILEVLNQLNIRYEDENS